MKEIRWVIQDNLIHENDLKDIQDACKHIGIEFEEITVIPFSGSLPKFTIDSKTNIYYGSTTLMYDIYQNYGKQEGLFFDDKSFSMENYLNKWGLHMLNSDAVVTTFSAFCSETHPDNSLWFIRPDADDKSFSGEVKEFGEIKKWKNSFLQVDNIILTDNTKIIVGPPYNIKKEWRNYIVNGRVIESTQYRENFRLKKTKENIPSDMISFVEDRCKEYSPHKIFVMDIALCGEDYYIIECGCLNSVGFYAADISTIVKSVSEYIMNDTFSLI